MFKNNRYLEMIQIFGCGIILWARSLFGKPRASGYKSKIPSKDTIGDKIFSAIVICLFFGMLGLAISVILDGFPKDPSFFIIFAVLAVFFVLRNGSGNS